MKSINERISALIGVVFLAQTGCKDTSSRENSYSLPMDNTARVVARCKNPGANSHKELRSEAIKELNYAERRMKDKDMQCKYEAGDLKFIVHRNYAEARSIINEMIMRGELKHLCIVTPPSYHGFKIRVPIDPAELPERLKGFDFNIFGKGYRAQYQIKLLNDRDGG